jgi:imidazolonepropionase-like amidohydrolase
MTVAIRCRTLFDGTGAEPVEGGELVVEDGKIASGPTPEGAEVVDLGSAFVMPGLIDAHTHLSVVPGLGDQVAQLRQEPGRQALRVPDNLRRDLDAGTTTLRIMGEEDWLDVYTREAIAAGQLEGPNLVIATRPIAASNGHGRMKTGLDGVDAIRAGARENLFRGADFLKLFATGGVASGTGLENSQYSYEEMRAAVEEAERAGTYVAAHAHGGPGLTTAAKAGIRTIEHAAVASDDEVQAMLDAGCWLVGTFSILFHPDGIERGDGGNPLIMRNLELARERVSERMEHILGSGLRLALGTDSMHGHMAYEVQTAVRFGVSPMDALLAATARSAEALCIESRTGTLEPGKDADVIALDGNPLDDLTALERVVFLMKGGTRLRG